MVGLVARAPSAGGGRRRDVVALVIGSVLSGVTESGILAILAESAVALSIGSRVPIDVGPVHAEERVGVLLAFAMALAAARLALQGVVSVVPARISADLQARLRRETFVALPARPGASNRATAKDISKSCD